jgi:hypothetical protein
VQIIARITKEIQLVWRVELTRIAQAISLRTRDPTIFIAGVGVLSSLLAFTTLFIATLVINGRFLAAYLL